MRVAARALSHAVGAGRRRRRPRRPSRMADRRPDPARRGARRRQPARLQRGPGLADILEQERWAAPLGDEMRDGLSTRIASGLGAIDVHRVAYPDGTPVYRVAVDVQRIESWPASHVLLDAAWSVSAAAAAPPAQRALTCRSIVRVDASAGYDALVDAHRRALDALAHAIAAGIRAVATHAAAPADCRAGGPDPTVARRAAGRGTPDTSDD
ncbi:PqiC family protein [Burkholderia multivorans]|uniref:PqiC family protein n=1 Tax=Burkholderia multivorans TaxID=87883 RepID=UPI0020B28FA1|nr:ABC-type transport auxiliary lipoprotein family protein [Burkholderia multivorans]